MKVLRVVQDCICVENLLFYVEEITNQSLALFLYGLVRVLVPVPLCRVNITASQNLHSTYQQVMLRQERAPVWRLF